MAAKPPPRGIPKETAISAVIQGKQPVETRRAWVLFLLGVEFVLAAFCLVMTMLGNDRWGFALIGVLCGVISHIPFVSARQSILSMWGLAAFSITFGAEVRGLAIALNYPSKSFNDKFFLIGNSFADLAGPAIIALAILSLLVLGYMIASGRSQADKLPTRTNKWSIRADEISEGALLVIAACYVAVGLFGSFNYYRDVGGLSQQISARRTTINASGSPFESFGQWEFLAQAGAIGAMLLLAYWLRSRNRLGPLRVGLLLVVFASSFSINIVTTTRADVVDIGAAVAVVFFLIRGRIRFSGLVGLGIIVILGIGFLTAERQGTEEPGSGTFSVAMSGALGNRNGFDLSKSAVIIDAVPDKLSYQNGKTIAMLVLTPIPRAVWPDKPVITPGPTIGRTIYGLARSGVPPGISAELVWNFGVLGALGGAIVVGLLLGKVGRRFLPRDGNDLTHLVFYALVVLPFGKAIVGVSVGQAASIAAQEVVLLVPLFVIGRNIASKRATTTSRQSSRLQSADRSKERRLVSTTRT